MLFCKSLVEQCNKIVKSIEIDKKKQSNYMDFLIELSQNAEICVLFSTKKIIYNRYKCFEYKICSEFKISQKENRQIWFVLSQCLKNSKKLIVIKIYR